MQFRAMARRLVELAQVEAVRRLRTLPGHLLGRRAKRIPTMGLRATGFRALAQRQVEPLQVEVGEAL